jgi:hypothetical protein
MAPHATLAGRSSPQAWVEIAKTPTVRVFVDASQVTRPSPATRTAWLRFDYTAPHLLAGTHEPYTRSIVQLEVNCDALSARELVLQLYDANNRSIGAHSFEAPPWHSFNGPGLGPDLYKPLCAWMAKH